ncbi:hypothetical protein ABIE59_002273 [Marinobacter sp. MBR-99]|mgnify:CR=1 FL=1|jgi:hypothetical protein
MLILIALSLGLERIVICAYAFFGMVLSHWFFLPAMRHLVNRICVRFLGDAGAGCYWLSVSELTYRVRRCGLRSALCF